MVESIRHGVHLCGISSKWSDGQRSYSYVCMSQSLSRPHAIPASSRGVAISALASGFINTRGKGPIDVWGVLQCPDAFPHHGADRENPMMGSNIDERENRIPLPRGRWRSSVSHGRDRGVATVARLVAIAMAFATFPFLDAAEPDPIALPWKRHVIDDTSRGADGTRLADANGDGRMDIVTGWEQGGVTRVYLHPGNRKSKNAWPFVTVGETQDVEDAVLVDLDRDGQMDVVSCCEGKRQAVLVHWAPASKEDYLSAEQWTTEVIPVSLNRFRWMFSTPMDVNGDGRVDLIAGGKGNGSELGWFESPEQPRDLGDWTWHPLRPVGWLMSLESVDMDGDGRKDILFTDRKGKRSGCYWLQHPGNPSDRWKEYPVGCIGKEAMFLKRIDLDDDGLEDILVATRPQEIELCQRMDATGMRWRHKQISIPDSFGGAKAPAAGDLDGDGRNEIVFTTERASDGKMGVGRFVMQAKPESSTDPFRDAWELTSISGVDGVKHDIAELIDLDGDGDLDLLTCEEVTNLGVIWYENPR